MSKCLQQIKVLNLLKCRGVGLNAVGMEVGEALPNEDRRRAHAGYTDASAISP